MGSTVITILVIAFIGIIWWRRRTDGARETVPTEILPRENGALKAFAHGNTCLAEGKFDEAITSFNQARDLDPKQPHIDARLAEVERQQQAANATPSEESTG